MKRLFVSRLRSSRAMRLATATVVAGQILTAVPVFAQDATRAAVRASTRTASAVQRTLNKARVRVNRTVPKTAAPSLEPLTFGAEVTTAAIRRARVFDEPLIPVGEPTAEDNRAVAQVLQSVAALSPDQQALRIEAFLRDSPSLPWRASLLANTATLFASEGYYSKAAAMWQSAWDLTRDAADSGPTSIADYVVGEWATQMMSFGQTEQMGTLFAALEGRNVRGTAGAKVSVARQGLMMLSTHHDMSTFSGPAALKSYLATVPSRAPEQSVRTINAYHPPMSGTSLADLHELAGAADLNLEMIHLPAVGDIPLPSVVHLKSQHFAAIVGEKDGRYLVRDPGLGGLLTLTGDALRHEASGYFLVPSSTRVALDARLVPAAEAASVFGHCAPGLPASGDPPCPNCGGGGPGPSGMPSYSFHPQKVSVLIDDVPLGYTPPVGPPINFHLSYDHRESRHPQTFTFGNVGSMWTHNWMSYVTEGPLSVMLRGFGMEWFLGGTDQLISRATLVMVSPDPVRYERRLPDGTVEVFAQADRPAGQPNRRIFLTEVIDPQGHAVTLTYDSSLRLVAIADALGQVTTLEYLDSAEPLRITRVTDPFGRAAVLTYDSAGRLATATDVAGLSSSFSYGDADFIPSMTTPYGTTTFRHEPLFDQPRVEATDPAGGTERLAWHPLNNDLPITSSEVPTGFSAQNDWLHKWNIVYWDKQAMAAGPTLSNAVITTVLLGATQYDGHAWSRNIPHSIKRPLESRVWYGYDHQYGTGGRFLSTHALPTRIARVVDGGVSQITTLTYNAQGMVTSRIDPAGRQTTYTYAGNGLDLLTVEQVRSGGTDVIQAYGNYNARHLPATITDAAGQTTTMTYNAAGQPLTVTNARDHDVHLRWSHREPAHGHRPGQRRDHHLHLRRVRPRRIHRRRRWLHRDHRLRRAEPRGPTHLPG